MTRTFAGIVVALSLFAGCAKKTSEPATAGGAQTGACVLKCEGKQVACKDAVPKADCTDPAKKATIFEALPKCPHEAEYVGGTCPK